MMKQFFLNVFFLLMGAFIISRPVLWPDNEYLANIRTGFLLFNVVITMFMSLMVIIPVFTTDEKISMMKPHERKNIRNMRDQWSKKNGTWSTIRFILLTVGYIIVGEWWFAVLSVLQKGGSILMKQGWTDVANRISVHKYDDAEEADYVELK